MPVYEFLCRDCGTPFEALVRTGGTVVTCPGCGATLLDKQVSVPAPVSRAERRPAGHTCCSREERCERPPCSDSGRCRRG